MNGVEFVTYMAEMAGYGRAEAKKRAIEKIEMVGMADRVKNRSRATQGDASAYQTCPGHGARS